MNWGAETPFGGTWSPAVSVSGQVIHVVWTDGRGNHPGIYYKRSFDGGTTWGADTPLTNNDVAYSDSLSLSVSGSDVHVAFRDSRNSTGTGYEIFHKHSGDGGITWDADIQLTNVLVTVYNPSVSASGSSVHVVWTDNHQGNFEIYYDHSADGGLNWETITRLTNNSSLSFYPFVSASGSAVHAIWEDNRDGNYEIYYKRNPTGITAGINELQSSGNLILIFPNPFTNEITINNSKNDPCEISIYDLTSRKMILKKFSKAATLNTSALSKGIYIYDVKCKNVILSKGRIIKD